MSRSFHKLYLQMRYDTVNLGLNSRSVLGVFIELSFVGLDIRLSEEV